MTTEARTGGSMPGAAVTFDEVRDVVAQTLDISDRVDEFTPESPLLGSVPELDSMAVVEVILAIEQRFGIELDDSEISGEMFETFGSLTDFLLDRQS
jgi:acyl carrier protein